MHTLQMNNIVIRHSKHRLQPYSNQRHSTLVDDIESFNGRYSWSILWRPEYWQAYPAEPMTAMGSSSQYSTSSPKKGHSGIRYAGSVHCLYKVGSQACKSLLKSHNRFYANALVEKFVVNIKLCKLWLLQIFWNSVWRVRQETIAILVSTESHHGNRMANHDIWPKAIPTHNNRLWKGWLTTLF